MQIQQQASSPEEEKKWAELSEAITRFKRDLDSKNPIQDIRQHWSRVFNAEYGFDPRIDMKSLAVLKSLLSTDSLEDIKAMLSWLAVEKNFLSIGGKKGGKPSITMLSAEGWYNAVKAAAVSGEGDDDSWLE